MEKAEERDRPIAIDIDTGITREYLTKILDIKQRDKEIETNKAELEDKTKLLEECMQRGGVEILKDIDKLPQVIQGMKLFNKQIDEAEEQIMETSVHQGEIKKALHEIKRVNERVKESISGAYRIKELIENGKNLERITNKALIKVDALINERRGVTDEDARTIFLWVLAYKKMIIISRQFVEYSFYEAIQSQVRETEKKLIMTGNLLIQWWTCEITTGIVEIAEIKEMKEKTEKSEESLEIHKSRRFALSNREFVYISRYIYSELGVINEFTDYVNNARRRELLKISKIPIDRYSTTKRLALFLSIFTEYLKIDTEIKSYVTQPIDPAVEEYDAVIGKKIESIITSIPEEDLDYEYIFKKIRIFFVSIQSHQDAHFKSLSEMLIQAAYKCINNDASQSENRLKSIIAEKRPAKDILFAVSSEIRRFFRESKQMVHDIEQVENELDDIILKFTNTLVRCVSPVIQSAAEEGALIIEGFASDLLESIKQELINHKCSLPEDVLYNKLPDLKKTKEQECAIIQRTEEDLSKQMKSITDQIKKTIKSITPRTEVSLHSDRVSRVLEQYKGKVHPDVLQGHLDTILAYTIEYIDSIKIYKQMDALENDFAILYKSVQYLDLETLNTKRILKMFTEIDCLRKEQKKSADDEIAAEINTILDRYTEKK
ncbi:hypothetical protein NEPAR04_1813 [Nematocida parisii]|nr:hypothetical protein NEPAR04_1813 [Nematocida parisii]